MQYLNAMLMKGRKRKFWSGECLHVYQRSVNGFILFYDLEDFLSCYTMISMYSDHYKVRIIELCFMVDHHHLLLTAETSEDMAAFMRDFSSAYVMNFNSSTGRTGQLLQKSYGSAPKRGEKKVRSTIIYIGNNPVEKKLCNRAEEYQWNFLSETSHSKDKPLHMRSLRLRKICKEIRETRNRHEYMSHNQVRRLLSGILPDERSYVCDYIRKVYHFIDREYIISYFNDYESMLLAMASTTGSEHDIKETFVPEPDTAYREMVAYIKSLFPDKPVKHVVTLSFEEKMRMFTLLKQNTTGTYRQVCRFLHMDPRKMQQSNAM